MDSAKNVVIKVAFSDEEFKQIMDYIVKKNKKNFQDVVDDALESLETNNSSS